MGLEVGGLLNVHVLMYMQSTYYCGLFTNHCNIWMPRKKHIRVHVHVQVNICYSG